MLAEWRAHGWAALVGREPEDDDLIVPLPPATVARRTNRSGPPYRGYDYSGRRWREVDLPALGWRERSIYDTRATFITLLVEDGAEPDVIRDRVTHTKAKRTAFDGYNRGPQWETTCVEVAKLKIERRLATPLLHPTTNTKGSAMLKGSGGGLRRLVHDDVTPLASAVLDERPRRGPVSRGPEWTGAVASLATALADAVLVGNFERARDLALQVRAATRAA